MIRNTPVASTAFEVRIPRRLDGYPPKIAAAFPEILQSRVEVEESGVGLSLHRPARRVALDGLAHISCSNPYCVGGGVPLLPLLNEMVSQQEGFREMNITCSGAEFFHNVPLGGHCPNTFHFTIDLRRAE